MAYDIVTATGACWIHTNAADLDNTATNNAVDHYIRVRCQDGTGDGTGSPTGTGSTFASRKSFIKQYQSIADYFQLRVSIILTSHLRPTKFAVFYEAFLPSTDF